MDKKSEASKIDLRELKIESGVEIPTTHRNVGAWNGIAEKMDDLDSVGNLTPGQARGLYKAIKRTNINAVGEQTASGALRKDPLNAGKMRVWKVCSNTHVKDKDLREFCDDKKY